MRVGALRLEPMSDVNKTSFLKLPTHVIDRIAPLYQGRRVCVTGGAGFIGGHLVDALVSIGAIVTVIDDLSNSSLANLAQMIERAPDQVRFVQASILDPQAMDVAVEGAQTVFHLAALGSVPKSIEEPARTWTVNATGSMRVLQSANKAGVERLVYSASSSAYGNNPALPKVETMAPEPESPYAAAKHAAESLCRSWSACYGLDTVSLRYFNIFGPRQAADSAYAAVIPAFVTKYLLRQSPTIYGDGEQTRDFTHVTNAVAANLLAGSSKDKLNGSVFNVGAGVRTSVNELAEMIANNLEISDLKPIYEAERVGEVRDSYSSVEAGNAKIGYEPGTSLEEGLKETVSWYASEFLKDLAQEHAES